MFDGPKGRHQHMDPVDPSYHYKEPGILSAWFGRRTGTTGRSPSERHRGNCLDPLGR